MVLPDAHAITLFGHLCRALSANDSSLPDALDPRIAYRSLRDPEVPFKPAPYLSSLIPIIRLLEREKTYRRASDSIHEWLLGGGISSPLTLITRKASLWNYLSGPAIQEALGVSVDVRDRNNVPLLTGQALHSRDGGELAWGELPSEMRLEKIHLAKVLLAEVVGPALTVTSLRDRRAKSEVGEWLHAIKWALPRRIYS